MDVSISRYKHTLDTVQCDITLKTNLIKAYKIIIKVQKLLKHKVLQLANSSWQSENWNWKIMH